jgi:hypothetical protein
MGFDTEASAALVFLILYAILFVLLAFGFVTRRIRFLSRHAVIFFHVVVRLASQATGLAFGIIGYSATDLLVAYFILGKFLLPGSHLILLTTSTLFLRR